MWKKILIGCLVIGGLIAGLAFCLTSSLTKSADQFFSLIEKGQIEKAYQSTSKEFQVSISESEFESFLSGTSLIDFKSASWSSRIIKNNIGELEGSIKTKDGGVVPIKITLVKEGGKWKIFSIEKTPSGVIEDKTGEKIPEEKELITMTNSSMLLFAQAVEKDDFSEFYESISKLWQSQTDEDALRETFKGFVEREVDFTIISDKTPVFTDEPFIDGDGLLTLTGYYPTEPYLIYFKLNYIFEYPNWQLFGIEVNI